MYVSKRLMTILKTTLSRDPSAQPRYISRNSKRRSDYSCPIVWHTKGLVQSQCNSPMVTKSIRCNRQFYCSASSASTSTSSTLQYLQYPPVPPVPIPPAPPVPCTFTTLTNASYSSCSSRFNKSRYVVGVFLPWPQLTAALLLLWLFAVQLNPLSRWRITLGTRIIQR